MTTERTGAVVRCGDVAPHPALGAVVVSQTTAPAGHQQRARYKFADRGGVSRKVHARLCSKCGRSMLVGLDDDRCAITARVDPTPLNAVGEASALMNDRPTFALRRIGGEYVLDRREAETIAAKPAGGDNGCTEVLAWHECAAQYPAEMCGPRMQELKRSDDYDEPPF